MAADTAPAAAETKEEAPDAKRPKTEGLLESVLSPHVLEKEEELAKTYKDAKPFPHGCLENIFQPSFIEKVQEEIKSSSKVKFKESDLYRVFQGIDLANLTLSEEEASAKKEEAKEAAAKEGDKKDEEEKKEESTAYPFMPSVLKLRNVLYSLEFRALLERLTNLPPNTLTDQVDCACNCHAPGCHLLCHDDVIGTRKVSYILYLTEPDWSEEEGGALQLYERDQDASPPQPKPIPSVSILPKNNTLAYFTVQSGTSFHAVQEVMGERPRLSLQGWFHAKDPPSDVQNSTLHQLKEIKAGDEPKDDDDYPFAPMPEVDDKEKKEEDPLTPLSDEDCTFLKTYMNETYLTLDSMKDVAKKIEEESSVLLYDFLNDEWKSKVEAVMAKTSDYKDEEKKTVLDYEDGVGNGWTLLGPPHKQRFLRYAPGDDKKDGDDMGPVMGTLQDKLFTSKAFGQWLRRVSSLGYPLTHRGMVRRFRPGLDYTVAHFDLLKEEGILDATFCFVKGSKLPEQTNGDKKEEAKDESKDEKMATEDDAPPPEGPWQSGDYGGFECYIAAEDDEDEAPDEYNEDDDTELWNVSACSNTLSLVYRDPGTMRFIKYVGSKAPSSRWDITMEYQVEQTEETEEKAT